MLIFDRKGAALSIEGRPWQALPVRATAIKEHRNFDSGALLLFAKNDPAKLGHFCRAESAPFDALRGVTGYLGAEIPVGDLMGWRERCRPRRTHRELRSRVRDPAAQLPVSRISRGGALQIEFAMQIHSP